MNAPHAEGDALTRYDAEGALLMLRARDLEERCAFTVRRACQERLGGPVAQAYADRLERAGESDLIDGAAAEVIGTQARLAGGEFHFLRPDDGDDLVLARAGWGFSGEPLGRAEPQAILRLAREQEVRGAEKGCDEARRRPRVQLIRAAELEQPPQVHDADAV